VEGWELRGGDPYAVMDRVEAFLEGTGVVIEHHPHASKDVAFIGDMASEDIEKCGLDVELFDRVVSMEGFDFFSTFKLLTALRRVLRKKGYEGFSLKLGEVYTSAALSMGVPMGEIINVVKYAHRAHMDAHMAYVAAVAIIKAVQAMLNDERVRNDCMMDVGNGVVIKIGDDMASTIDRAEEDVALEVQEAEERKKKRKRKREVGQVANEVA